MKMRIKVNLEDGTNELLIVSKLVEIKTAKNVVEIEKLTDGTVRMIYSAEFFKDFEKVVSLELIRI